MLMLCLLGWGIAASAQESYDQSAGVRFGRTSGLTFKKFIVEEEAIEVLLSGRNDGLQVHTMYVWHQPMEFSFNQNFYAYYGIGGHLGFERYDDLTRVIAQTNPNEISFEFEDTSYYVMGADAILGIEYRWLSVPITISFDIKPYANFIGLRYLRGTFWDSGISFKYVF